MLFPPNIIFQLMCCARWADQLVRADLIHGFVVSENDYTSNFTCTLRREINARNIPGLTARVQVLNPRDEREIGADACIILQNSTQFKVSVFEGKWPRLCTHKNYWDSIQQSSGVSHFHSQILRQKKYSSWFAIWEMFYCEFPFGKQPGYFPPLGSACVWHSDAYKATIARPNANVPWTDLELQSLLGGCLLKIEDVIAAICLCSEGKPLRNGNFNAAFDGMEPPHSALVISYSDLDEQ